RRCRLAVVESTIRNREKQAASDASAQLHGPEPSLIKGSVAEVRAVDVASINPQHHGPRKTLLDTDRDVLFPGAAGHQRTAVLAVGEQDQIEIPRCLHGDLYVGLK